ncbi:LRR [Seminavis robusta]|uniref:LRR n=1 Tax=Seminavis robusta TaxID=568900 RepID=A0A9N8DD89_9STRA|nr:LRR [Seminavis robusta]|eukprot:Sro70_g038950.1 LRR (654) ;mRNA; r:71332-73293
MAIIRYPLPRLNEALVAEILSFSDTPDLIHVLETQDKSLIQAAQIALSNATALHFSYLLQMDRCRNHGSSAKKNTRKDQESCIRQLMDVILSQADLKGRTKLQRIEFSGMRHVVGNQGDWLKQIFQGPQLSHTLISIDFSGCALLDPTMLQRALMPPPMHSSADTSVNKSSDQVSAIRHLTFQGCYRIDEAIVLAIARSPRFRNLQTLGLGGCSQSISDQCVSTIIKNLRQLRYLDLSGLKRITEQATTWLLLAATTLESLELAGCELLRFNLLARWTRSAFGGMNDPTQISPNLWTEQCFPEGYPEEAKPALPQLARINFNGIGTPRRGLVVGALPYFACRSMGALREVYLSGCEHIRDWEVQVLAVVCANSLTCLEMRACCIGDDAVKAVGRYCTNLADVDFSACFQISDHGILALCQHQGTWENVYPGSGQNTLQRTAKKGNAPCTIRSLKIAALPQLTKYSIVAIGALDSLIVLDVNNCPKISSDVLAETVKWLPSLVEVDAKGIGKWSSSVAALYSYETDEPRHLRFVNGRPFSKKSKTSHGRTDQECSFDCCIVKQHSKRFSQGQGVPLQAMYHCIDCKLIPALNRGICHACLVHCHRDHKTFVGSYTRFYCDCPFGVAGSQSTCQSISCDKTRITEDGSKAMVVLD